MGSNWASLSDKIIFSTGQGPSKFKRKPNGANWVEQDLIQGKARMQRTGINLQSVNMTIRFHAFIAPFSVLCGALEAAYVNGDVLQLIYGTGEAIGDFVIMDMEYTDIQDGPTGLHIARDVDIVLREYAGPGVAAQTGIDAKQKAFANKVPTLSTQPVPQLSTMGGVTANLTTVTDGAKQIQKKASLVQQAKMSIDRFKREVVPILAKIQTAKNTLETVIAVARNIRNAPNLSTALSNVGVATSSLGSTINAIAPGSTSINDINAIAASANNLSNVAGSAGRVAQPMQGVGTWWKVDPYLQ